jgi:hypothetical protein
MLASYFYLVESAKWEHFELEMRQLRERSDVIEPVPEWETRKRKCKAAEQRKFFT